ncbi:MAG: hypothetical protein WC437_00945 [Patescibacteria group bacterium]|jgi:L-fucose isomerase-like protein|nr:hypothetical protein [Patescibacteria group bacterium]
MGQRPEKQGSFFDEEETRAREFDKFKKRMEMAFGVPFDQIDKQEMYHFIHEVNEDDDRQEKEEKRIQQEEALKKQSAETLRTISEIRESLEKNNL